MAPREISSAVLHGDRTAQRRSVSSLINLATPVARVYPRSLYNTRTHPAVIPVTNLRYANISMHRKKRVRLEAYPCRVCLQNCTDSQASICCDGCQTWMHADCIRMSDAVLQSFADADVSFLCRACACDSTTGRYVVIALHC